MKKYAALLLAFVFVLLSVSVAFAAEAGTVYYVDALGGNDAAEGTAPDAAWKTLAKASERTYGPGDRLLFRRGGVYDGGLTLRGSGTEASPVTVSAYGEGALPVLTRSQGQHVIVVNNVSNWIVEDLDITAPNGFGGILIVATGGENTENITVRNCVIHDISPNKKEDSNAAVYIDNDRSASRVKNLRLDGLKIYNVAWGVQMHGIMAEDRRSGYQSPEASFNKNFVLENICFRRATFGAIVAASVQDCLIRNCRVLECAVSNNGALAPLWTRHVDRVTIEYCEIAGSTNVQDGMAIDFDGWSTNSTYRYIYSHDNTRFMRNCVYDSTTKNSGNSVYNCVSVNDGGVSFAASTFVSFRNPSFSWMSNFSFHDNIFVNSGPIVWIGATGPKVSNNYFRGGALNNIMQKFLNALSSVGGFTYSVDDAALSAAIAQITADLPEA